MKNIRITILLFIICFSGRIYSQSISVSSFNLLDKDLTANTAGTMEMDQNGETAALIKVVTTQTGFTFDGGALGVVKTKQTPSEIWVYVPKGSKKITIKHPQLGLLRDYYYPTAIEAARTYEMVLVSGEVNTIVKPTRTTQYVVFQFKPSNAVVELDGDILQTVDGTATKMMKFGSYNYRVQAPNYLPEAGNIIVNDPNNKHIINISLKPNYSYVFLRVENEADIWVNGEFKGKSYWIGRLGSGTYEFETRKVNHRSTFATYDISASKDTLSINLQPPTPIFGEVDIISAPAMADIYIDSQKVGQTPQTLSNILIGRHRVRIQKKGYETDTTSIFVKEGEVANISVNLKKLSPIQNNVSKSTSSKNTIPNHNQTFKVGNVSFNMIFVEGGTYKMGATSEQGSFWPDPDEHPVHKVTLDSYLIGETEVTQELWNAVLKRNPSHQLGSHYPVEEVSWNDCQLFIEQLNKLTGQKFRLPTEAEWEYAARGGNKTKGFRYPGSNEPKLSCWYDFIKAGIGSHEVGKKLPNELGLYDMGGNVWEWCEDWKDKYPSSEVTNPTGPTTGTKKVVRGGSFKSPKENVRITYRSSNTPDYSRKYIGFRLAL